MNIRTKPIDKVTVRSVYSGRPGCCCGCNGDHRYATAHRQEAGNWRGYAIREDETSDRSVSIIVNKINRRIEEGATDVEHCVGGSVTFVTYETETRLLIAYLTKDASGAE